MRRKGVSRFAACGPLVLMLMCTSSCFSFIFAPPGRRFKQRHRQRSDYRVTRINLSGIIGWRYRRIKGTVYRIGTVFTGASTWSPYWLDNDSIEFLTEANDKEGTRGLAGSQLSRWPRKDPLPPRPPRAIRLGPGNIRSVTYATKGTGIWKRWEEMWQGFYAAQKHFRKHLGLEGVTYTIGDKIQTYTRAVSRVVNADGKKGYLCYVERQEKGQRMRDEKDQRTYGIFFSEEDDFQPISVQEYGMWARDDSRRMTEVLALDLGRRTAVVRLAGSDSTFWLVRLSDWKAVKLVDDNYEYVTCRLSPKGDKLMYLCRSRFSGYISDDWPYGYMRTYPPEMHIIDLTQAHKDLDSYVAIDFKDVDPGFRPATGIEEQPLVMPAP